MTTPVDEPDDFLSNTQNGRGARNSSPKQPSTVNDEENTDGKSSLRQGSSLRLEGSRLTVETESRLRDELRSIQSPTRSKEEAHRLEDDLTLLRAERHVSHAEDEVNEKRPARSRTIHRSRSRKEEPRDDFDFTTSPKRESASVYSPPDDPHTSLGKIYRKVHDSTFLVRYFVYITPLVLVILLPLLLGALLFKNATVGDVYLMWFCIWLEIAWLTLWAGRILAKCLPWPIGLASSLFTNNSKKWRDMGKQLEIPATLFFWGLALEISFLPTMRNHHADGSTATRHWESVMNKVLIAILTALSLNFAEKIIIQLIAIRFHLRTYSDRIDINKFQIASLVKLYNYSKEKIKMEDKEFEENSGPASGVRTPAQFVKEAQRNTAHAINVFGDVAGKIAADFTGREAVTSTHPHQVILTLLSSNAGSQVLARRLFRTFCREDTENVHSDDLRDAFENDDEADAAFTMFDKDMNGDISMEELEAVCVEIGRERKSITASLKDLDSVVSKLDHVLLFIVFVIAILVFVSIISSSAAGVLTSAGSAVLALSWLFSATAQEFLQSVIFVFVKHPFDVGDRVSIYGNTGSTLTGDDYFVKEISLLFTEFKKMEGHIVQAPNSSLNTLFILNQRRSGGLAEAIPVVIKFGTTLDQIDSLRSRLLDFVTTEKREYQANILTELREVIEAHSITMNVVFFYKSNWQNELLRLQRRNKFICALMVSMQELGIEGPRMRYPGQKESFPMYLQNVPYGGSSNVGQDHPGNSGGSLDGSANPPFVEPNNEFSGGGQIPRQSSVIHQSQTGRHRGESLAQMGRRLDFSLGMKDLASSNLTGDVYEDRQRLKLPPTLQSPSRSERRSSSDEGRSPSAYNVRRSTSSSRQTNLQRVGTDSSLARARSNHHNRFFGRGRGVSEVDALEKGMADIPEHAKLDPRSGRLSPAAWKTSTEELRTVSSPVAGPAAKGKEN